MMKRLGCVAGLMLAGVLSCNSTQSDQSNQDPTGDSPHDPAGPPRFFLPTPEPRNTSDPRIEVDADGNLHVVYPAYILGDAFYAWCPANCRGASDMSVVQFRTAGTVHNAMLALDHQGRPQVLMSTMLGVYWATCAGDCGKQQSWTTTMIVSHEGDLEVTGEAFAVTGDGKPRFIMHTYRAFLGVEQAPPQTFYVTCNEDCHDPASWRFNLIADQIWQENSLRLVNGEPRIATVATVETETGSVDLGAYVQCDGDNWKPVGLYASFSDRHIEMINPAISMDLTADGGPRVVMLGRDDVGDRNMVYLACDQDCTRDSSWAGTVLISSNELGAGLDLKLHPKGPRIAYTADYNILLAYCDSGCERPDGSWNLAKVEFAGEMKPDEVIPYPDCTVAAWFLRYPNLALGSDELPRVVYRAEDISGGGSGHQDPNKPICRAGADMVFGRFARMTELRPFH